MVQLDSFSSLDYLLSLCGGGSIHTRIGMNKYTCIYIAIINIYIKNASGTKKYAKETSGRQMLKSKRKLVNVGLFCCFFFILE